MLPKTKKATVCNKHTAAVFSAGMTLCSRTRRNKTFSLSKQVSWLRVLKQFPSGLLRDTPMTCWYNGGIPLRLQWRYRSWITHDSLLSFECHYSKALGLHYELMIIVSLWDYPCTGKQKVRKIVRQYPIIVLKRWQGDGSFVTFLSIRWLYMFFIPLRAPVF